MRHAVPRRRREPRQGVADVVVVVLGRVAVDVRRGVQHGREAALRKHSLETIAIGEVGDHQW